MDYRLAINSPEAARMAGFWISRAIRELETDGVIHELVIREYVPEGTNDQIRTIYMWYREVADQLPGSFDDEHHVRRYCKLNFGVPILMEDVEYCDFFVALLERMDYEKREHTMKFVDVVKEMSKRQRWRYMNAIQHEFDERVKLTKPGE